MSDKVAIYEARYINVSDPWDYYPADQMPSGILDVLSHRDCTSLVINYTGELKVEWRKRYVDEDTAYELETDYMNYIAERGNR